MGFQIYSSTLSQYDLLLELIMEPSVKLKVLEGQFKMLIFFFFLEDWLMNWNSHIFCETFLKIDQGAGCQWQSDSPIWVWQDVGGWNLATIYFAYFWNMKIEWFYKMSTGHWTLSSVIIKILFLLWRKRLDQSKTNLIVAPFP